MLAVVVAVSLQPAWEKAFFHWLEDNLPRPFANDWVYVRVLLNGFVALFAMVLAIAIHECGHLLAGLAVGFQFKYLCVGRLQIDRSFKISRNQPSEDRGFGTTVFAAKEMRNQPLRVAFMTLAGPLANFIFGFALMMVPFPKSLIMGWFVLVSLFLGIENLIPFQCWGVASDGMHLFRLLWSRAKHERRLALVQILEDWRVGMEAASISPGLLAAVTAVRDKSLDTFLAHWIAFAAAYDRHKDHEAAQLLEICLRYSDHASLSLREGVIANAGIFQADRRKRVDLAKQWLGELPQDLKVPYRRLMVEGAILEAQENYVGALQKIDEIEKTIVAGTEPARQQIALRPFAKWKTELQQKVTSPSSVSNA
jgi:hypothetical protein